MINKNLVLIKTPSSPNFHRNHKGDGDLYALNPNVSDAISEGKKIKKQKKPKLVSAIDILENIGKLFKDNKKSIINAMALSCAVYQSIEENQKFPLIKEINDFKLEAIDLSIYTKLIWDTICGRNSIDISATAEIFFPNHKDRFLLVNSFMLGDNPLIKEDLVAVEEGDYFNNTGIKLTDKSHRILTKHDIKLKKLKTRPDNLSIPDNIVYKKLFYPKNVKDELQTIRELLSEEKLHKFRNRIKSKALSNGLTILMHGKPGTGKTETVYQLAKASGREIIHVDISQAKSMWFGESEKIVKQIFKDYSAYRQNAEKIPILLLNEADAIISKRKDIEQSNTAQTENAIQNIILETMENFDGILIATTNMLENMDSAFERRFLFKINFTNPDVATKAQIWKNKLPELSAENSKRLAEKFNLNGAQIDNIVTKCLTYEIINYKQVNIKQIEKYCEAEDYLNTLQTTIKKIGF